LHVRLTTDVLRHHTSAVYQCVRRRIPICTHVSGTEKRNPSEPDNISSSFLFPSGRRIPDSLGLSCNVGANRVVTTLADYLLYIEATGVLLQ